MKKFIAFIFFYLFTLSSLYASDTKLLSVKVDINNKEALQRGAQFYMNYCSGCHALRYLRYNRMAQDLGLTTFDGQIDKTLLQNNLIFTQAKPQDPIEVSMPAESARQWFGRVPPDLSLTARERSPAWIYTYLKSFYADPKSPFHTNNLLIPDVSMPNVLAPLSGVNILRNPHTERKTLLLIENGTMTKQQFDQSIKDLVTFLTYVSEPIKPQRISLGLRVLPFLFLLLIVVYLLKKSLWKKLDGKL